MTSEELLPDALVFDPDGHVSEIALTALADGEVAIVPAAARGHVDRCETCARRLGAFAILSVEIDDALASAKVEAPERPRVAYRFPVGAVAAAVALALIGLLPTLLSAPATVLTAKRWLRGVGPIALRLVIAAGRALVTPSSAPLLAAIVAASLILVAAGITVARRAPLTFPKTDDA
jgi:hypothetical protein